MELKKEFPGIRILWSSAELYDLGQTIVTTPAGNPVKCYDAERSIADLKKAKENRRNRYATRP